jgi:hypothetical protein
MKVPAAVLILLCFTSVEANARWRFRDLDPLNRHGGIRQTLREHDPLTAAGHLKVRVVNRVGMAVASNPEFRETARREGWTLSKCRVAGAGLAVTIAGFQGAVICAACVAGEPVSATACTGLVIGAGTTITEIACTQLCHDRHLLDCK